MSMIEVVGNIEVIVVIGYLGLVVESVILIVIVMLRSYGIIIIGD